jgi:hypothetical protein
MAQDFRVDARGLRIRRAPNPGGDLDAAKSLPVGFALPWGPNVGLAAFGSYLPLPAKLRGTVCRHFSAGAGGDAKAVAAQIEAEMDRTAQRLTNGRNPYLDWLARPRRFTRRAKAAA